jgi:hypothetical protein
MSSNRANASARQRRAGGAEMPPPAGQNMRPGQQRGNINQPPQQQTKLSVSDAMALVTLRLGRVETFIQKIQHEGLPSSSQQNEYVVEHDANSIIINKDIFNNITDRLDGLEKGHKNISLLKGNDNNELNDKVKFIQTDLTSVKDMVLKLQSFVMDTNFKFSEFSSSLANFNQMLSSMNEEVVELKQQQKEINEELQKQQKMIEQKEYNKNQLHTFSDETYIESDVRVNDDVFNPEEEKMDDSKHYELEYEEENNE